MAGGWWPAIRIDDLWEGEMTVVTVEDEQVLLVNIGGALRAYSNACPHQASPLDDGDLEGERLTCARHLWQFNALTGLGINPMAARLKSYGCEVRDDGLVYVELGR
jgi:toluene monooxygenase system ferredoxin subunit